MPRRLNGEGTIYQRKNGLWCAELTVGYDGDGKRVKKTLSSMDRDVLVKKANEERRNLGLGLPVLLDSGTVTVEEWLGEWLTSHKEMNLRPSTRDLYRDIIANHVNPEIGKVRLCKLNSATVQKIYNSLAQKGIYNTAGKTNVILNQAFDTAVRMNLMALNPNDACTVPKQRKGKVTAMTKEEQKLFEESCRDNAYGRAFLFMLSTGLRIGELIALTWADHKESEGLVSVNKTALRVSAPAGSESRTEVVINPPKTEASVRDVPLNKKARAIIEKQKDGKNIFVFSNKSGQMLDERNIRREMKAIADANAGKIKTHLTPHVLRHTFATRMIEKGANIKALSKILGHTTVQMTLDIYTDITPDFKRSTMELLDE